MEMAVAHLYGRIKAQREEVLESSSVSCDKNDINRDLQNLTLLITDLKLAIEMHNRLLHATLEEKKEKMKLGSLNNLYLRKMYHVVYVMFFNLDSNLYPFMINETFFMLL